ncbi:MAG: four helix bundle protein [Bacteroidia bacterium]|nr:four helix bundle protein [Bacteroidia bacterium]
MTRKNALMDLSFEFALEIIEYSELLEERKRYVIARQVLKSGTSIGANVREAQSSESLVDFIHKLKISEKEANETEYWLDLCKHSKNYPDPQHLYVKLLQIKKLHSTIITTSKSRISSQH